MSARANRLRREIQALLDQYEVETAEEFLQLVDDLLDRVVMQDLIRELERGDIEGALITLGIVLAAFRPLQLALSRAFNASGSRTSSLLPRLRRADGRMALVIFDPLSERAARIAQRISAQLVTRITEEQRALVRAVIADGLRQQLAPAAIATQLVGRVNRATGRREGGVIGLNGPQSQWLLNMRSELASGSPARMRNYFARELRDRRFDPIVLAAIEAGRALSSADIDMVSRSYSNNLRRSRGRMIAQMETGKAIFAARNEAIRQAFENNALPEDAIIRRWRSSRDELVRETHVELDGQEVRGLGQPFVALNGDRMMHPLDDSLGADISNTANCRCSEDIEIDFAGVVNG